MFSAMVVAVMASEAHAQESRKPRVDPAYLEYLAVIEEIGEMDAVTTDNDFHQLFPGMVGFVDVDQNALGTVFVGGTFPQMKEVWFLGDTLLAPGEPFGLVHTGSTPPAGQETDELEGGWSQRRCYDMTVKYTNLPNDSLASKLTYTTNVDRYHFELWQDEVVVGRLLREHHHVPNMPELFIDHWAFYPHYTPPYFQGESVWMHPGGGAFVDGAEFFADVKAEEVDAEKVIWKYTQIQYKPQLGFLCAGALNDL